MTYREDCREEDAANAEDAMREDIAEAVAGRYSFALQLAIHCVGRETYDDWREQSHDVPSCAELVELALTEGPGIGEVHDLALRDDLAAELTGLATELAAEAQA